MSNPYMTKAHHCFWSRAMTALAPGAIDPMVADHPIGRNDKIATMGSCFAQHLSKYVQKKGFNYFVTELPAEGVCAGAAARSNYGVFSARYGNVYTVRQALQLFQRAFGEFRPEEDVWAKGGRFFDPFRPQIEPDGFPTPEAMLEARQVHEHFLERRPVRGGDDDAMLADLRARRVES